MLSSLAKRNNIRLILQAIGLLIISLLFISFPLPYDALGDADLETAGFDLSTLGTDEGRGAIDITGSRRGYVGSSHEEYRQRAHFRMAQMQASFWFLSSFDQMRWMAQRQRYARGWSAMGPQHTSGTLSYQPTDVRRHPYVEINSRAGEGAFMGTPGGVSAPMGGH